MCIYFVFSSYDNDRKHLLNLSYSMFKHIYTIAPTLLKRHRERYVIAIINTYNYKKIILFTEVFKMIAYLKNIIFLKKIKKYFKEIQFWKNFIKKYYLL